MYEIVLAVVESEPTNWPDAFIVVGMLAFMGFCVWCVTRR